MSQVESREFGPRPLENPQVISLIGSAGVTAVDMQLFANLRDEGFSVFVHGSLMESRVTPSSDVDFTVVGDLEQVPSDIKDTLFPRYSAATDMKDISYVSTSNVGQNGRKLSLHMSNPDFRTTYAEPGNELATEYRPARHAKKAGSSYFLSGMDSRNNIFLANLACFAYEVESGQGTVTDTPQTGVFHIDGRSVYADTDKDNPAMTASNLIKITPGGKVSTGPQNDPVEVMLLGLEFDKMQSDTPLYSDSYGNGEYDRFVVDPIKKSMDTIGEYTDLDSRIAVQSLFAELAKYWPKIKPNKARVR